ncbi:hypothetical protein Sjap_018270 [Stephania japonica]|uniref:Mei2-like C-terminal RNA recognition motif domain-containing protein n=1 Tax=Stephania japonica TaxID=461633 RepID=A0AAP0I7Q9_9MAGN
MLNPQAKPFHSYHHHQLHHSYNNNNNNNNKKSHHNPFSTSTNVASNPPWPIVLPNNNSGFPTLPTNKTTHYYFYRPTHPFTFNPNKPMHYYYYYYYSPNSRPFLPPNAPAVRRNGFGFGFGLGLGNRGLSSYSSSSNSIDFDECEAKVHGKTTVMIKNIPSKLNRKMLVEMLDTHCFHQNQNNVSSQQPNHQFVPSEYDFVYLPIDFKSGSNLGYAFVNFTTVTGAVRLYRSLQMQRWEAFASPKICEIKYARIQGKKALIGHFQHRKFRCNNEDFLPIVFLPPRNGVKGFCSSSNVLGTLRLRGRRANTVVHKPCRNAANN